VKWGWNSGGGVFANQEANVLGKGGGKKREDRNGESNCRVRNDIVTRLCKEASAQACQTKGGEGASGGGLKSEQSREIFEMSLNQGEEIPTGGEEIQ